MAQTPYQMRPIGDSALKNLIINGNFDFWQRGTGSTSVASSATALTYLADRFGGLRDTANAPTMIQSTDVPTVAQSGFQSRYSLLFTNNASGVTPSTTTKMGIVYRMEGQDYQAIHGQQIRVSFWVKSSVTGTFSLSLQNSNAVSAAANSRSYIVNYTISSANTWEKKSIDIVLDTNTNYNFDNSIGLSICWTLGAGTSVQTATLGSWVSTQQFASTTSTNWAGTGSATFQLAQVLITSGTYSSGLTVPFSRAGRTIGDELRMCQRYYNKMLGVDSNGNAAAYGMMICATSSSFFVSLNFPTPMRASGAATTLSGSNRFMTNTTVSLTGVTNSNQQWGVHGGYGAFNTSATLTAGAVGAITANADATAFLAFDSEL